MNNTRCAVCGTSDSKLFRCSQCKSVCYCCKEHQRQDWKKGHKALCALYQGDIDTDNAIAGTSRTIPASLNSDKQKKTAHNRRTYVSTRKIDPDKLGKRNGTGLTLWDTGPFTDEGSSENEILNARIETLRTDFGYGVEKHESKEELRGFAEISLDGPSSLEELEKGNILEEVRTRVGGFVFLKKPSYKRTEKQCG